MVERRWEGTGHVVEVPGDVDRVPRYDPRSGEHLWIVSTMYRVDPVRMADPSVTPLLDQENLLLTAGPICFYCEQVYEPRLLRRRCPGGPGR